MSRVFFIDPFLLILRAIIHIHCNSLISACTIARAVTIKYWDAINALLSCLLPHITGASRNKNS